MHVNRLPLMFLLAVLLFTLAAFTAPFVLQPHTVGGLDGRAWHVDYEERWQEMPVLPRLAYTAGDMVCHQKHERSYSLHGNQMPVCARDVGLLLGLTGGFALALAATPAATFQGTFRAMLPFVQSRTIAFALLAGLLLPLPLDGFAQLLSGYESVNVLRTATGLLFGFGVALLASLFLVTDPRRYR
ncbi:MAG: DUF2085 domain-containing protein [Thermoplasmatota archaeon]